MIDATFLQKLEEMVQPKVEIVNGKPYTAKPLEVVPEPMPESILTQSLAGIVDLIKMKTIPEEKPIVHVLAPDLVRVYGQLTSLMSRPCYAAASYCSPLGDSFFSRFIDSEEFVISLMAKFVPTADLTKVLGIAGNLQAEAVVTSADDGTTQRVTVRQGISQSEHVFIQNPVALEPQRTFAEVRQPASPFIFRTRGGGGEKLPMCALFLADGGKWELEAIESIREWLVKHLPEGIPVIA